ncbi:hypothetical protein Tco_0726345 [Tanacetum coccineum]|uniref:Reverse transcriptase zinc-binding domain-containing protein n=1 Tax=Tanacetum coccineum TaxID=301880 RepID=A0ABQ4YFC4_9ASTR
MELTCVLNVFERSYLKTQLGYLRLLLDGKNDDGFIKVKSLVVGNQLEDENFLISLWDGYDGTSVDLHVALLKNFVISTLNVQVWCHMRDVAGMSHVPPSLELILDYIIPIAKRRTSRSVISKLVLASSTYFIWQERNELLFKSHKRTAAQVIECIMSAVRLKLVSCRFKKSKAGLDLMKRWKIPEVLLI